MGRLSGFRYREITKKLRSFGFVFDRQAAGSGDMPEGTLRAILKQAGVDVDDFIENLAFATVVAVSLKQASYSLNQH